MPRIKVYESYGSVVIEFPNNRSKAFLPNSGLSASYSGNNVSISYNSTILVHENHFSLIRKENGTTQWSTTAQQTSSLLNDLFGDANPSDIASKAELDNLKSILRKIDADSDPNEDEDTIEVSITGGLSNPRVAVKESTALMSVGDTKFLIQDGQSRFTVKSNTGNLGQEVESDAIVISGQESSGTSIVDIKGILKVSETPENKFSMVNTDTNNGRTSFTGSESWLTLPSASSYSNSLMLGKSVVIGDADDTLSRGTRNYFKVSGLSTGDVVEVTVKAVITSDQIHTLVLDDDRTNQSGSTLVDSSGTSTVTVSMSNVVDNYSDVTYHLSLTTTGSGNYRISEITVTIS